jgi:hypothetical protein
VKNIGSTPIVASERPDYDTVWHNRVRASRRTPFQVRVQFERNQLILQCGDSDSLRSFTALSLRIFGRTSGLIERCAKSLSHRSGVSTG